jgi:RNA binding exosome subunit
MWSKKQSNKLSYFLLYNMTIVILYMSLSSYQTEDYKSCLKTKRQCIGNENIMIDVNNYHGQIFGKKIVCFKYTPDKLEHELIPNCYRYIDNKQSLEMLMEMMALSMAYMEIVGIFVYIMDKFGIDC